MPIIAKPIPTDNPSGSLIGFNNLLTASTTSDAEKALTPNTYERFEPASGALTVKFQMSAAADVDFIAIAAHALIGESVLVQTAATIGGALTDVDEIAFTDNAPVMLNFDTRNIEEIALVSTLIADSEIGVVSAGKALQMPRNIYGGHSPITLSQKTEYNAVRSESGQILGKTIIRKGLETAFSWQFLDDAFYRNEFQAFVESARQLPFFLKWRPDFYSTEVVYGETNQDIQPANMGGGHRLMSVDFTIRGHADL
jgi:hypothetical protein